MPRFPVVPFSGSPGISTKGNTHHHNLQFGILWESYGPGFSRTPYASVLDALGTLEKAWHLSELSRALLGILQNPEESNSLVD